MARSTVSKHVVDYSSDVQPHRSAAMRYLLVSAGLLCFGLGFVGIFVPLLPTTPFILLAAACFARGSSRFYNWLLNNRYFGHLIRDYRRDRCVPRRVKTLAIAMIAITIGTTALFVVPVVPVKILLVGIGTCVSVYLWRLPETPQTC